MKITRTEKGKLAIELPYTKWGDESNGTFLIYPKSNDKLGKGVEIDFTQMYEAPEFTFKMLTALSEFFGTQEIDFNDSISRHGCETCDYGSRYGYMVQIYGITQNYPFEEN